MSADLNDVEAMDRRLRSAAARVRDAEEASARLGVVLGEVEAGARLLARVVGGGVLVLTLAAVVLSDTSAVLAVGLGLWALVAVVLAGGTASLRSLGRAS